MSTLHYHFKKHHAYDSLPCSFSTSITLETLQFSLTIEVKGSKQVLSEFTM